MIDLGEIHLGGYTGVGDPRPPRTKTFYGFVHAGAVCWSWGDEALACWLRPGQAPKYAVRVVVPAVAWGRLADHFGLVVREAERLRREYRRCRATAPMNAPPTA